MTPSATEHRPVPDASKVESDGHHGHGVGDLELDHEGRDLGDRRSITGVLEMTRILVVEDDDDARDLLVTLLEAAGAEVEQASSVEDGWKILLGEPRVDLLVSDLGMPREDGYALIERLRASPQPLGGTPAIALTAFVRNEDRKRTLNSGFDAHAPKPIEPDAFIALAARVLAQTPPKSRRTVPPRSERP